MRRIEVCSNNEWLTVYGPMGDVDGSEDSDSPCNEWFNKVVDRIEAEFSDVEAIRAQGQRTLCHGWNGCNTFSRNGHGIGTFDEFTDEEWERCENIAWHLAQTISERHLSEELDSDIAFLKEVHSEGDLDSARSIWVRLIDWHELNEDDPRIAPYKPESEE